MTDHPQMDLYVLDVGEKGNEKENFSMNSRIQNLQPENNNDFLQV
jgi:hypothetical protein